MSTATETATKTGQQKAKLGRARTRAKLGSEETHPVMYVVNGSGTVHRMNASAADEMLREPKHQLREATKKEIAAHKAQEEKNAFGVAQAVAQPIDAPLDVNAILKRQGG